MSLEFGHSDGVEMGFVLLENCESLHTGSNQVSAKILLEAKGDTMADALISLGIIRSRLSATEDAAHLILVFSPDEPLRDPDI